MKLLAIDGNSIMNRAYYGIKQLSTSDGIFTNAIQGFMNIYFRVKGELSPEACAVAFDLREPTFRHKACDTYKANRHGMDDELAMQMPYIKEILGYMGVTVLEVPGFEADDILGTLSTLAQGNDHCYILTGDRDSLQLVNENVTVMLHTTRELINFTPDRFSQEYEGLKPPQLVELKGLMGDSSDNISGVRGIGQKTALGLIKNFGTIENLYDNLDEGNIVGTKSVMSKLADGRESARMSRFLAEIVKDVPVEKNIYAYRYKPMDTDALAAVLSRLEMVKIIEKMKLTTPRRISAKATAEPMIFTPVKDIPDGDFTFAFNGKKILTVCGGKCYETNDEKSILKILSLPFRKRTFGAKRAYRFCMKNGVRLENIVSDAQIAAYLLDTNEKEYTIRQLTSEMGCNEYENMEKYTEVCQLEELCTVLDGRVADEGQEKLYREIELPLTEVLASMEHYGVAVDSQGIRTFGDDLKAQIGEIEQRIYFRAGHEFNIASPKQLAAVLFEEMGLPSGKKTKSGYSTNAEVLNELADKDPIVADVLLYRQYTKLMSTYVDGLLKQVEDDGRIHTVFKQTETRTGRISSTEPNLQNIPVRTELGRNMRKFFVAQQGRRLIDADYSQIELRILAHLSNDENMRNSFLSGVDIHAATAAQVFDLPVSMVTPQMRRAAKAVNFGIVYGISAFSLAKDIDVSQKEAQKYIKNYLDNFAGVRDFMQNAVDNAKKLGYSETMFGRRRYIPELASKNNNIFQFGKRAAMNAPVQGTAADIIKIAMIRVYNRLAKELPEAHLVLQIHDELIIEADEKDAEKAAQILAEEMPGAAELSVPLATDVNIGESWYDTH